MKNKKLSQSNRKLFRIECITTLCCLLPLGLGAVFYGQMPERVPVHFGFDNQPDRYAGRGFALFGLPLVLLALQLACCLLSRLDQRGTKTAPRMQILVRSIIPVISLVAETLIIAVSLGSSLDVGKIALLLLGLLALAAGNYLPKCRQNFTLGIKLPTTLASEDNWNRTHRMAGRLWMAGGLVLLAAAFLPPVGKLVLSLATVLIMVAVPVIYSAALYKREKRSAQ